MTKKEAVQNWVNTFNAIPMWMMEKLYSDNLEDIQELTAIRLGDTVYSYKFQDVFEVNAVNRNKRTAKIEVDGILKTVSLDELSLENESGYFPMWDTMWTFGDCFDKNWAENNVEILSDLGFRIYQDYENDEIFIGIDGAGYNFYSEHWMPLYDARGLQWHDETTTAKTM